MQQQNLPIRMQTGALKQPVRLPTGMKGDPNFQSVGMSANIKVFDRPLTNHGVTGMNAKQSLGDGRKVIEKSYFLQQLRSRIKEIYQEIEKFKSTTEDISKDNTTFSQFEKKFEDLTKDVRNLEGQLADYNLAFDKQRAQTRPEEIRNMYEHIKIQNDRYRQQLDEIYIDRKNQEQQIQQIEQQLHELNQMAQMKINELDPDQRTEYESLINENRQLLQDMNSLRIELEDTNNKTAIVDNKLRMDPQKLKGQLLKDQIQELERKKTDLEIQLNEANLSFPEARDKLLARIKEDNNFIANTDKRIKEIKKNIDNYEKKLREISNEEQNPSQAENEKKKYEVLFQKDKEMTEFIENYDKNRNQFIEQIRTIQNSVVELLEQSSKIIDVSGQIPSGQEFNEIQGQLEFKQNQADLSKQTLVKLQKEFEDRSKDVQKLEQADERLIQEMQKLQEKVTKYQEEIKSKFDNINQIKIDYENKRKKLIRERDELTHQKAIVNEDVKKIKYDHDLKEKKIQMHEIYSQYSEAEKKLINNENQVNNLRNFILTKTKDLNYEQIKDECKKLMEELNGQLVVKK